MSWRSKSLLLAVGVFFAFYIAGEIGAVIYLLFYMARNHNMAEDNE